MPSPTSPGTPAGVGDTGGGGGLMTEVPDKAGWLWKFATGRSLLGRRNWRCRYVVSNVEGIAYYDKEPFVTPKGFIPWEGVTHLYPVVNSAIDPAANDPELSYFGLRFVDPESLSSNEYMLLLRCETGAERSQWVDQMRAMSAEADRIRCLLDDDDTGGGDGPTGRATRRRLRTRGTLLSSLETRLRTMVSLKKQRFVKDGLNLDLAYVGPKIIAMGYPSTGKEAMFRNPYTEVLEFFRQYHNGRNYKVYNLCSERAYPPSYFGGRFERYPFDDHNPSPVALIPPFVESAKSFLAEDEDNVVAIHCKAGKGRTGMFACCLLLALGTCSTSAEVQEYFAKHRTQDGKGVQIPSQRRFIGYYSQMLRLYSGSPPPAPPVRLSCCVLSSTPRFDPDGGCDPFVIISRRRPGHKHVPLGQSEANVHNPLEVLFDSRKLSPPQHVVKQRDVRLGLRDVWLPGGELKFEVFDQDKLSKDDIMMGFWIHTGFLPLDGVLKLTKEELDDAVKDKSHQLIDKDFVLTLNYRFAEAPSNAAGAVAKQSPRKSTTDGAAPPSSTSPPPTTSGVVGSHDLQDL